MRILIFSSIIIGLLFLSCQSTSSKEKKANAFVQLVTLDPAHFHAALVQKTMYDEIDPEVNVYAPGGPELQQHLDKIEGYNKSAKKPTHWKEVIYKGHDYLDKMLDEKKGNVVVIAGNNKNKTEYIWRSIDGGFNVLADKPMAIDQPNFELLKKSFATAAERKLLLYDIMTERYEITNALQRELASIAEIFGTLKKGTPEQPSIEMESVHFFYKTVSGSILKRPSWFMDVTQQGEGISDVATHLVDLVQWECFPGKIIDYNKDINVLAAKRWSTDLTLSQFNAITGQNSFPVSLKNNVVCDSILQVFANGSINYKLNNVYVKVTAKWNYKAAEGGDTHYSLLRGTKANLVIRQGGEQKYKPTLYIVPVENSASYEKVLKEKINQVQSKYPGIEIQKSTKGWEVIIPEKYREGHEAHFAMVTRKFLEYLKNRNMPEWEVPNMLAKYYTTTKGLEVATKNN